MSDSQQPLFAPPTPTVTVLSYGAGQDSTCLLYRLGEDPHFRQQYAPGTLVVVFSDTGMEFQETMAHVETTKQYCATHHIEFWHLTPDLGFHSPNWKSLLHFYQTYDAIGSRSFPKVCSQRLKIEPIHRFLEHWISQRYGFPINRKKGIIEFARTFGRIQMMIGISAGEERRIADPATFPRWKRLSIDMRYPLVELGWTRRHCQDYIASLGYPVPPPSNCRICHYASHQELLWLERHHPEDLRQWITLEANKLRKHADKGVRNHGVWGLKTLPMVMEDAHRKWGHLSEDDLNAYKFSHGHNVTTCY